MAEGGDACRSAGAENGNGNPTGEITIELCDRMAQGTITSTESLIEALNEQGETGECLEVLLEWVDGYIEWFDEVRSKGAIKRCAPLREYCVLAGIKPVHKEQKSLLSNYFDGLCNSISTEYQHGEEPLVEALEHTLQTIDIDVFNGNPAPLEKLGKKLLAKLDLTGTNFTRTAYPSYRSILHALHLTLMLIRRIDPNQWDATEEDGLYSKFRVQVQGIAKSSNYYLICYHAHLIEQSLRRLALAGKYAQFRDDCRRVCQGLKGVHSFWKGAKSIAILEFNIEAFESAYKNLQAAIRSQHIKKMSWYDLHQSLHHACLRTLTDHTGYKVFKERLQDVQNMERLKGTWENCKALRIGVIQQLRLLVLEGHDACIRTSSMEELSSLAESCKSPGWLQWLEDKDVLEELLDCLGTIAVHSQGKEKDAAVVALEIMMDGPQGSTNGLLAKFQFGNGPQTAVQKGIKAWLGERTLDEKLRTIPGPGPGTTSNTLFNIVNRKLRLRAPMQTSTDTMSAEEAHETLRKHYLDPTFATMDSVVRGQAPKHVDSFQCQLMLIEQVQTICEIESEDDPRVIEQFEESQVKGHNDAQEDDLCVHHKRLEWVKTPIALDNLMKSRSIKPGGPKHEIRRVLLVGNPGTGKTALSRKLAYSWARGMWGQEFPAIYVLQVRALQQSKYDNVNTRRDETLATAVANNCFHLPNKDEEYKRFRNRVSEDLEHPMTLVILDGLDERYGASEELLKQAKAGPHKLLMLSRPYGIEAERPLADIEIEHVGLNDQQMEAFIKNELSGEGDGEAGGANDLLAFIHAQPAIQATAHVPVNLQILCTTWQDDQENVCSETKKGSLHGLYRRLTMCVWDRYKKEKVKYLRDQDRDALFTALGHIAMRGLQEGALLFSQGMVEATLEEACGCVRAMVDDAGFLLLQKVGKEYQFPHLTFQEYFAGCLLARQFFSREAQKQTIAKKFVSNSKYDPRYRVVLTFMAGEVVKVPRFDGIKEFLMLIEAHPKEVVGLQHVLLQTQILNEWLCVSGKDREEKLSELEGEFQIMENLNRWFVRGMQGKERERMNILSALATGLQGSHVVAHDTALEVYQVNTTKDLNLETRLAAMGGIMKMVATAPGIAPIFQEALLAACDDLHWQVRQVALEGVGKMVKVAPRLAPPVQEALIAACNDSYWQVRQAALEGVDEMMEIVPRQALAFQGVLIAACNDAYWQVSEVAVQCIGKMVRIEPALAPAILKALLATIRDSDGNNSNAAIGGIGKMVEVVPGLALAFQEPLLDACNDSYRGVRQVAVEGIGKIVAVGFGLIPDFQKALVAACNDSAWQIRQGAAEGLGKMVEVMPELSPALQEVLVAICNDSSWQVRRAAAEGIGKVMDLVPGLAPAFQEALIAACNDSAWQVREVALDGISKMVGFAPGLAPPVLKALMDTSRDSSRRGFCTVVGAIGKMVETAPGLVLAFKEALIAACNDSSWRSRQVAVECICKMVEVAPGQAPAFQEALVTVCDDSDGRVRLIAVEGISKVVKVVPGLAPAFQETLIAAYNDSNVDVRWEVLGCIGKVVKIAQEVAPAFQEALVAACNDSVWQVRLGAVDSIGKMVEVVPGIAPAFHEALVALCNDSDWHVRRGAVDGVGKMAEVALGLAPVFKETLMAVCNDSYWHVRQGAVECIGKVVKVAPELASAFLETLAKVCYDSDWHVRWDALKSISNMVEVAPGFAPAFQGALIALCNDSNWHVREGAVKGICKMVEVVPRLAPAFQEALVARCNDSYWHIRRHAVEGIGEMVEFALRLTPEFQEVLQALCDDLYWQVREAAVECIGKVVEVVPGLAPAFQKALVALCNDSDRHVRQGAVEGVGNMVKAVPGLAPAVLKALIATSRGSKREIFSAAIEGIRRMVEIVPGLAPVFQEALIAACDDSSWQVREVAAEGIGKMVEVVPGQAPALLEAVLALSQDSYSGVCDAALEVVRKMVKIAPEQGTYAVRERLIKAWHATNQAGAPDPLDMFSLRELIEDFWTTQNELFLLPLVSRLYSTPLVQSNPSGHQHRLVLYPPAGKPVILSKPEKAVKGLVKRIQSIEKWMRKKRVS